MSLAIKITALSHEGDPVTIEADREIRFELPNGEWFAIEACVRDGNRGPILRVDTADVTLRPKSGNWIEIGVEPWLPGPATSHAGESPADPATAEDRCIICYGTGKRAVDIGDDNDVEVACDHCGGSGRS